MTALLTFLKAVTHVKENRNRNQDHISSWTTALANHGAQPGKAFTWMGGNEAYGRPGASPGGVNPGRYQM